MKVGFIGLGNMGTPIARNLLKGGHQLTVYNRTRSRAEALSGEGAKVASTPAEAASGCEALVTMLADDAALRTVLFEGKAGESLPAQAVHISMSTISVEVSRELTSFHRGRGQHFVAAPVFGRPEAAAAAKLFVVAAGGPNDLKKCQPLFDAIGQKTFVVSEDPSAANLVKLAGNFLLTAVLEGLAETFALVRKHGLDANSVLEVLTGTLFPAPVYKNYGAMLASDKFEPVGFKLPLGLKDNRLLLAAAEKASVPMPLASLIRDQFIAALAQGLKDADWAAIGRVSYRNAGLTSK